MINIRDIIKISIDQGLKKTGLVVWRGRKPVQWECFKKSFPKSLTADMTLEKCRFRWKEIEDYLVQKVILEYQPEPITEIILEKFMPIKTTNQEQLKRVQPLVKLNIFTGYLLGRFEGFGGASPKVYQVGKGTQSKGTAYFAARDAGIPGGLDQDIYDACYHGILAGADRS